MGTGLRTLHIYRYSRLVERRASKLIDPVERLRYLRQAMRAGAKVRVVDLGRAANCMIVLALLVLLPLSMGTDAGQARSLVQPAAGIELPPQEDIMPVVWQVESAKEAESYSNGLRIDNRYRVANQPRGYWAFERADLGRKRWRRDPAGIVFHTTESHLSPFEAEQNHKLKRVGQWLLEYVRQNRSYHFLIDRFGRVHRVVEESDAAHHAGHSVWADQDWAYLNLNASFLGVALETRTEPGATPGLTPAQTHATRMLTEMLRHKHRIAAVNCLTHAQVSVNPRNMRIGNHVDWAGGFPFAPAGLPDNYALPLPSLELFGFEYDSTFIRASGESLLQGMLAAEQRLGREALESGMTPASLRGQRRDRYQRALAEMADSAGQEKGS